ncbi:MAG: hypothetical protein P8M50_07390 [Paracoccaceae bacterium]|nr:hypothetical protein [Paracoccaceae bacterium]
MCSACGFPEIKDYWIDAGTDSAASRLRSRLVRAKKLSVILKKYGLFFYDDGVTQLKQIGNLTGRVELVPNLEQLWEVVEDLLGKPLDPLDKKFFYNNVLK